MVDLTHHCLSIWITSIIRWPEDGSDWCVVPIRLKTTFSDFLAICIKKKNWVLSCNLDFFIISKTYEKQNTIDYILKLYYHQYYIGFENITAWVRMISKARLLLLLSMKVSLTPISESWAYENKKKRSISDQSYLISPQKHILVRLELPVFIWW